MRTNSKVVLVTLGLGSSIYLGRQCWRKAKRGGVRRPDEREECPQASETTETTPATDTDVAIQAINQGARVTSKDLWKWLVILRSAVLDLVDVSCCGLLARRLNTRICVTGVDSLEEDLILNKVLDDSLFIIAGLGLGVFLGGKIVRKYLAWEDRLKGTPANSSQITEAAAATSVNSIPRSSEGQTVRATLWVKLKALRDALFDQLDFWSHFNLVDQVMSSNRMLHEINEINERTIHALQRNFETSQQSVANVQGSLANVQQTLQVTEQALAISRGNVETLQATVAVSQRLVAAQQTIIDRLHQLENARARLAEQERQQSLTAQQ